MSWKFEQGLLSQRYFEHQVLTLAPPAAPPVFINTPRIIRAK